MKPPDYSDIPIEKVQQAFEILKNSQAKEEFIRRMPESGSISKQENCQGKKCEKIMEDLCSVLHGACCIFHFMEYK